MSKLYNKLTARILTDIIILFLLFSAPWYIGLIVIVIATLFFFPYFEIIVFASILDAYYGSPHSFVYTGVFILYFIIVCFLQQRILLK